MTNNLISACFSAFLLLALVSPFLPLFLMWRSVTLSALAFISFQLLLGPVHDTAQNWAYGLAMAFLQLFVLVVFVALAIRLCIAAYFDRLTVENLVRENMRWADRVLLAAAGAVGGLVLTSIMASILGGGSGGRMLDLGIGLSASAVIILMVVERDRGFAIPVAVLSVVVATISFAGSEQSRRIVEGAEALADGRPWCLVVPKWRHQEPAISDLGFFSLPKGRPLPHLVLFVRDGNKETKAYWSIRKQRFVNGAMDIDATCNPQAGYPK